MGQNDSSKTNNNDTGWAHLLVVSGVININPTMGCPDTSYENGKPENIAKRTSLLGAGGSYYYRLHLKYKGNYYKTLNLRYPRPFSILGDKYTSNGSTFGIWNHIQQNLYNGLISDGHVTTAKGPLTGSAITNSTNLNYGRFWNYYLQGGDTEP